MHSSDKSSLGKIGQENLGIKMMTVEMKLKGRDHEECLKLDNKVHDTSICQTRKESKCVVEG